MNESMNQSIESTNQRINQSRTTHGSLPLSFASMSSSFVRVCYEIDIDYFILY